MLYSYIWLIGLIDFDWCLVLNNFIMHGMCILAAERSAKEVRLNQLLCMESQACSEFKEKVGSLEQQSKFISITISRHSLMGTAVTFF